MRFRWTVIFSDIFIHAVTSHISLSGPRIIHWTSYWVHYGFISPYFKTFITKSRIIVGRPFPDCAHSFSDSAHFSLRPQQHLHFTSSSGHKSLLWYKSYYYGRRVTTTRQNISCGLRFRLTKTQGIINVSPVAETLDWRRRQCLPGNHSQCNMYLTPFPLLFAGKLFLYINKHNFMKRGTLGRVWWYVFAVSRSFCWTF